MGDEIAAVADELSVWAAARGQEFFLRPDACIGLGIKCVTPYEMLRRERARFVLGSARTGGGA